MEKLKLKYITLKDKLAVKCIEADEACEIRDRIVEKCEQVENRLEVLRQEVEALEEQRASVSERNQSLHNQLNENTYNTEELRHTSVHLNVRREFKRERHEILQKQLQTIKKSTQEKLENCEQLTRKTNEITEKLNNEEDKVKVAFRRVQELEAAFSDLVDQVHIMKIKDNDNLDKEDETSEKIHEMELVIKQTITLAETFENKEGELEHLLKVSDDKCEEAKKRYTETRAKFNELVDEIMEM